VNPLPTFSQNLTLQWAVETATQIKDLKGTEFDGAFSKKLDF